MSSNPLIDQKSSALLVMDYQRAIVESYASDCLKLLARMSDLIKAVRNVDMNVIYVVVGFRTGYPEVNPRNQSFGPLRGSGHLLAGSVGNEVHPSVAPMADDVIVTKRRINAFAGTDMDIILRAKGIDTLILAGISTSGVVLSTVRHAADADYRIIVVSDCCADIDPEVHRILMEKVFPLQAAVISAKDAMRVLS